MPLKAIVDGTPIIAPLLSDTEWDTLGTDVKNGTKHLRFECCENTGHLRVSKRGTRHFVHTRRDNCTWKPESPEHLQLKADILTICSRAGWSVDTEVDGNDWVADILAWKNERRVVFEIQLSYQTFEKTKERTSRYRKDGIEVYWLFKKMPITPYTEMDLSEGLNLFRLIPDHQNRFAVAFASTNDDSEDSADDATAGQENGDVTCMISAKSFGIKYGKTVQLPDFVAGILDRTIQHRDSMSGKYVSLCYRIVLFPVTCWRCGRISHAYYVDSIDYFESSCGILYESGDDPDIAFDPRIVAHVRDVLQRSGTTAEIKLGDVKERYSKTVGAAYPSFGCAYCDALFGDFFMREYEVSVKTGSIEPAAVLPAHLRLEGVSEVVPHPHWCQAVDDTFCEGEGAG